jgi:Protein of unknown function (DUF3592)
VHPCHRMQIIFLLVGLGFVAVGILLVAQDARMRRGAHQVRGEVVGFSKGPRGDQSGSFYAVAQYSGPDGQTRYLEASVGSSSPLGAVGDAVTILVHPEDPQRAAIKSSLPSVIGGALALMGIVSCAVFFATFRADAFSMAGAVTVVGWGAWKLHGARRDKPMPMAEWREYKRKLLAPRIFTEATKQEIAWADPAAVQDGLRKQQNASRAAVPLLLVAGVGLLVLGVHLHQKTARFLRVAVAGRGVVVDMAASASHDGTTWAPVVQFEDRGHSYRFKDSVGSNPPSWRRGDPVDVLYDPSNPADARIDRGRWNKLVPDAVALFGALLASLGIWMIFRRPRPPLRS